MRCSCGVFLRNSQRICKDCARRYLTQFDTDYITPPAIEQPTNSSANSHDTTKKFNPDQYQHISKAEIDRAMAEHDNKKKKALLTWAVIFSILSALLVAVILSRAS